MALSNTAVPKYYGMFRDAVLRGEIPVNQNISMEIIGLMRSSQIPVYTMIPRRLRDLLLSAKMR